jgi:hypothetical protein
MVGQYADLIAHDAKFGKVNTEGLMSFGKQLQAIKDEGYERALNVAKSGGSLEAIATAFSASGKEKFDPKQVLSDQVVKGPNGIPTRMIKFRGADGSVQTIDTTSELTGLGKGQQVLSEFYQAEQNRRGNAAEGRANAAEGRAATVFKDGASTRQAAKSEADLRVELANLDDSSPEGKARSAAIQDKLIALRTGTRGALAGNDPADVIKAKKLVAQGIYNNEGEAIDAITVKPDKMFQEFQKAALKDSGSPDKANDLAESMMERNGWQKGRSGTWRRIGSSGESAGPAKGSVVNGFEFLGGNPNDKKNWRQAPGGKVN